MTLSNQDLILLSALLDEALDLTDAEQEAWLRGLADSHAHLRDTLRELLARRATVDTDDFLHTLPPVVAAAPGADGMSVGLHVGAAIGPYELVRALGSGGMGSVWLATRSDGSIRRPVALKLPYAALHSNVLAERFARERDILAELAHSNIARLYDAGITEGGQPYLALEYVDGVPLTEFCDAERRSIRGRLELFLQVLAAVQHAHTHLVIHRDLKPSNILVTAQGQVMLLDFGIAKLIVGGEAKETALTLHGGRVLTPDYAAPEQIAGAPITTGTDVYALGVMLYELLTGGRPYRLKRNSRGALEEAILQADPAPPSRLTPSETAAHARATTPRKLTRALVGDLDTITVKALKKSPAERYRTAESFGDDIARFLGGDVVMAQRDSVAYRAAKFARRHWVAMAAGGILGLTLAGGLAATSYEAAVASRQRDAAFRAQLRSVTQTAAARLKDGEVGSAMDIALNVLSRKGTQRSYTSEALNVFQEARAADFQVMVLSGHTDRVWCAAFSPDGRRVITVSDDKSARIWDAATGREVLLLNGHTGRVETAAFSPDGRRVVTASYDKSARIWDAATGREILLLSGHTGWVTSAEFSRDGENIVTASVDKTARIWDAATGQQIRILNGHAEPLASAAFSPDGHSVVTASADKTARLWDTVTGRQIRSLIGHAGSVWFAGFSTDGARIVTASSDKTARIWDAATGQQIALLNGHAEVVESAAFSPDGRRVVTASHDKTARIWDTATGQQIRLLSGHTQMVAFASFSPDGRSVVTASDDGTARIWNAAVDRQLVSLNGHTDTVETAVFSPDGQRVATGSDDNTVRIWDAATGRQMRLLSGHTDLVSVVAFSYDGQRLVTASRDNTARIWDVATGEQIKLLSGHTSAVISALFSPDGRSVVTASSDKTARIWDAETGQQIRLLSGHTDRVWYAAFSPDGRRVVTASYDKTARIWDTGTGRQMKLLSGHRDRVLTAAFSPDGGRIITASSDKTARIWDAATGQQIRELSGHESRVDTAAFSGDGRRVVTASDDQTARIWDAVTGQQILLLGGHEGGVSAAAFSPDGRRVVTASDDNTARIWDARVPALDTEIEWAEAAQFDPLPSAERFQLGLPAPSDVRRWSLDPSKCDESAAAPYDPDRLAPGVMLDQVVTDIAAGACVNDKSGSHNNARSIYQHGRALAASGNLSAARNDFQAALADGYRVADVELALLFCQPSGGMIDIPRAISLLEHAWSEGVPIAAFQLGSLYEHGVTRPDHENQYVMAPDNTQAWAWYRKGADASEPNALARFAEREDGTASSQESAAKKNAHLLESFKYYAAAAERARREDWPDEAWRNWRYRRASLARLLAREGMMQEVAEAYAGVGDQQCSRVSQCQ